MRPLSASELLAVWERGSGPTSIRQALAILSVAFPEVSDNALAKLDVAQRDFALLHLRVLTFGPRIEGLAECPACHERLELDLDANNLTVLTTSLIDPGNLILANPETSFRLNDYEVTFRLPNSMDLAALGGRIDVEIERQQLLAACIIRAQYNDQEIEVPELPSEVLNGIVERMSQTKPLVDLSISATCPTCSHNWEIIFDIASFFWQEINAWAARLIREVHTLAMAYGWREADILAMSAWRRQQYLELIGA